MTTRPPKVPTTEEILAAKARDSLGVYVGISHKTDDGRYAIPPRHLIQQVIPALEDDSLGDTVIVAPPGSIKTNTMIGYLAWYLGRNPSHHVAYVCANGPEAIKRSLAIRDMIELSPAYKTIFPNVNPDKTRGWAQDDWYLARPNLMDKNPSLTAVGVGGKLKGARLHRLVYDDLSDDDNTRTPEARSLVWRFLSETGKTRLHPTQGRALMIGTREHEDDAIGYAIDRGWHQVQIRALNEDGESYWPEYVPAKSLCCPNEAHDPSGGQCCLKRELGPVGFARQFMGEVFNPETSHFPPGNWRRYEHQPTEWDEGCITIDTAGWSNTTSTGDYAVAAAWCRKGNEFSVLDVKRGRWLFTEAVRQILALQAEYHLKIYVEDVPWARPLIDHLKSVTWGVQGWPTRGRSKENRADGAIAPLQEAGNIWLPLKASWVQPFIDEHTAAFVGGKYDDQVDTSAMACDVLNKRRGYGARPKMAGQVELHHRFDSVSA